jgi:hypothetical protein
VVADRLSLRWYPGYDLAERLPGHPSLRRIRDRYGLEDFRRFFEAVVERCQAAGLAWGRELYIDGTKAEANAAVHSLRHRFYVEAHLRRLFGGRGGVRATDKFPPRAPPGGEGNSRTLLDAPAVSFRDGLAAPKMRRPGSRGHGPRLPRFASAYLSATTSGFRGNREPE